MSRRSAWTVVVLIVTACAGEPSSTSTIPTTTTTTTTTTASTSASSTIPTGIDVAFEFLEAVYESDFDLGMMDAAIEMTQPGSPARYFAETQRATDAAMLAWTAFDPTCTTGMANPDVVCPTVERVDASTVEVCSYNWGMAGHDRCISFCDIRVAAGRVVTFTVDGIEIESLVGTAGGAETVGPVTARVTSSYVTVPERWLRVAFHVTSTDVPSDVDALAVTVDAYVTPDGSRRSPISSFLAAPLLDTAVVAVATFEGADLGGTLLLDVTITEPLDDCSGDGSCTQDRFLGQLTLDVPVYLPGA